VARTYLLCDRSYKWLYRDYKEQLRRYKINPREPEISLVENEKKRTIQNSFFYSIWIGACQIFAENNWNQIYTNSDDYGYWYLILSAVLLLVFQDIYFYFTHRFMHSKYGRWIGHNIHHRSNNPTPWSALSMSRTEFHIQILFYFLITLVLPIHVGILIILPTLNFVTNILGHCGYQFFHSKLNVLASGDSHYIHHAKYHYNFGLYFNYLDRWFKTQYPSKVPLKPDQGIHYAQ
jgi:sterol desaturase/sphingolipid hydroxylase (fatty acid hydroxylase superfamily)